MLLLAAVFLLMQMERPNKSASTAPETHLPLLTGKVMAELDIESPEDEPIQYGNPLSQQDIHPHQSPDHSQGLNIPDLEVHQDTKRIGSLFESSPFGEVPIRSLSDGKTIFEEYQMPYIVQADAKGVIALVMNDYGLSEQISGKALASLPAGISFVISPYAHDIQNKITKARAAGHEVWLNAPIEPAEFGLDDSGPLTMLAGLNDEQNHSRLLHTLSLAYGYTGLVFSNPPAFAGAEQGLENIFAILERRGLALVSSNSQDTVSPVFASRHTSLPYLRSEFRINAGDGEAAILGKLDEIRKTALSKPFAVVFLDPQPALFPLLIKWQQDLSQNNIQLIPLSAAVLRNK